MHLSLDIVIPTYNSSKTISIVLDSLVEQTDDDFSVVLIDDCSTDNTLEIAGNYSQKLNLRIIQSPINYGGPAEPRNIGILSSNADYILLLDSDDLFFPSKIQQVRQFLTYNSQIDALYHPMIAGPSLDDVTHNSHVYCSRPWLLNFLSYAELLSIKSNFICNSSLAFRRRFLLDIGLYDSSTLLNALEDYDILIRSAFSNANFAYLSCPLGFYYLNPASSQSTTKSIRGITFMIRKYFDQCPTVAFGVIRHLYTYSILNLFQSSPPYKRFFINIIYIPFKSLLFGISLLFLFLKRL